MPPLASVVLFALEQLLTRAPQIYAQIAAVIRKKDVTVADLQALRREISEQSYESLVPNTGLNSSTPSAGSASSSAGEDASGE